jgi:hypothetical protein
VLATTLRLLVDLVPVESGSIFLLPSIYYFSIKNSKKIAFVDGTENEV